MVTQKSKIIISKHAIERFIEREDNFPNDHNKAHKVISGLYYSGIPWGGQHGRDFSIYNKRDRGSKNEYILMCTKNIEGNIVIKTIMQKDMAMANIQSKKSWEYEEN